MEGLYIFGLVSVWPKKFETQHGSQVSSQGGPMTFPGGWCAWDIMSLANGAWFIAWFHQVQDVVRHVSFQIHGYQYATRCTRTCLVCAFVIFCVSTVKDILHSSFLQESWMKSEVTAGQPSNWVQLFLSYIHVSRFKMFADSWFDELWSQPEPWWAPCSCLYLMSTPSFPPAQSLESPKINPKLDQYLIGVVKPCVVLAFKDTKYL